jgi:hypothetical protein
VRLLSLAVAVILLAGCSNGTVPNKPRTTTTIGPNGHTTTILVPTSSTATGHPLAGGSPWPDPDGAAIRPGARVVVGHLACTANFLFRSPDNLTLYIGVAAHCFGLDPSTAVTTGTTATVGGIKAAGKVVYNGWKFDSSDMNDFGLIQLSNTPSVRNEVNPAVMYYGGPTALGSTDAVALSDAVMVYGNSIQRDEDSPQNPRDGTVLTHLGDLLGVVTQYPGMPGDSGAGLMTADGKAIGVLSTGVIPDIGPTGILQSTAGVLNNYVELDTALAAMGHNAPSLAKLQLVTWEQYHGPSTPAEAATGAVVVGPQAPL